jgi:putative SOS response-associated peptidase YedK
VVTPNDGQPIAIAVIFEEWHTGPEALVTFVIVTTAPNALIRFASQTGCLLSAGEALATWLGETGASLPRLPISNSVLASLTRRIEIPENLKSTAAPIAAFVVAPAG